jgi:hypothetical protein
MNMTLNNNQSIQLSEPIPSQAVVVLTLVAEKQQLPNL